MSLTIARLRAKHWKCYPAIDLVLEPRAYAIVARDVDDGERSNWRGKSSLAEAIDYALTGRLPATCRRKQDWLTEGEKSGEVEVVLSDGSRIIRSQSRTGSERLFYFPPDEPEKGATQDEAQKAIDRLRGLTEDDDLATWYFRQGWMARLVHADPAERMALVVAWMGLAPIEECEAYAVDALAQLLARKDAEKAAVDHAEKTLTEIVAQVTKGGSIQDSPGRWIVDGLIEQIEECETGLALAKERLAHTRKAVENAALGEKLAEDGRRYEALVEEGKRLVASVAGQTRAGHDRDVIYTRGILEELGSKKGAAAQDATRARNLLTGQFDGKCPLVGEACPSAAFVRGAKDAQRAVFDQTATATRTANAAYEVADETVRTAIGRQREFERIDARVRSLRQEVVALKPAHDAWKASEPAPEHTVDRVGLLRAAEQVVHDLTSELATLRTWLASASAASTKLRNALDFIGGLDALIPSAMAAVAVFGKNGAQRRIAEALLEDVEARATELFAECGIGLSVSIRWSREGAGLAGTCAACGNAFAKSAKEKECRRCGTARGPNIIHKLEIEGSNRSGAADDLVGVFVQLAASEWLRDDRGSEWGVGVLDEPFAAMDAANRRAFAQHLPAVLARVGLRQSFVIAHHSAALDALPGRIEIVSRNGRSTATVVA